LHERSGKERDTIGSEKDQLTEERPKGRHTKGRRKSGGGRRIRTGRDFKATNIGKRHMKGKSNNVKEGHCFSQYGNNRNTKTQRARREKTY